MSNCNQISIPCLVGEVVFTFYLNFLSGFSRHRGMFLFKRNFKKCSKTSVCIWNAEVVFRSTFSEFCRHRHPLAAPPGTSPKMAARRPGGRDELGSEGVFGTLPSEWLFYSQLVSPWQSCASWTCQGQERTGIVTFGSILEVREENQFWFNFCLPLSICRLLKT